VFASITLCENKRGRNSIGAAAISTPKIKNQKDSGSFLKAILDAGICILIIVVSAVATQNIP